MHLSISCNASKASKVDLLRAIHRRDMRGSVAACRCLCSGSCNQGPWLQDLLRALIMTPAMPP